MLFIFITKSVSPGNLPSEYSSLLIRKLSVRALTKPSMQRTLIEFQRGPLLRKLLQSIHEHAVSKQYDSIFCDVERERERDAVF